MPPSGARIPRSAGMMLAAMMLSSGSLLRWIGMSQAGVAPVCRARPDVFRRGFRREGARLARSARPMLGDPTVRAPQGLPPAPLPDGTGRARRRTAAEPSDSDERQVAKTGNAEAPGVSGVAGRYASALFDLAREEKALDDVSRYLDSFDAMLAGSPDLQRLVRSPVFTAEEQQRSIAAILDKAGIAGIAGNVIRLVAANRRLFILPDMIRGYRALVARSKGIVAATVTVAEEPSDRMLSEIKSALREMAGSDVDVGIKVDPSLIGGLVVKIGSRMVDASLKTKLNSIRIAMKEAR